MKKEPLFFLRKKFMGGFIAVLMILSISAVFTSNTNSEKDPVEFNGKWFYPYNLGWFTYINNVQTAFPYLPDELTNISSLPYVFIDSPKVYIITDPNEKNITFDLLKQRLVYFLNQKGITSVPACSQEEGCPDSLPIKDCKDINVAGIFLKSGVQSRVYKDYMCYVIEGDTSLNLNKATEKLIYLLLGVI
ncbi:hypothetical protein J4418_04400 [Candidatus Woesearchaeota archaeon]|nr:hypothetical protein [Candidatus Woesearchaeota archaeon]